MSLIIITILIILLVFTSAKWFGYYCSTKGLLYYLWLIHNDTLDGELLKEFSDIAARQTVSELFGGGDDEA